MAKKDNDDSEQPKRDLSADLASALERIAALELKTETLQSDILALKEQAKKFRF